MVAYYRIVDLNMIGKDEDYIPYVYQKGQGWVVDNDNVLMDRVMGYDDDRIGGSDMMSRVEEIPEEEAMKLINQM